MRQIVFDLTEKNGGPAGILCDPIEDIEHDEKDIISDSPFYDPASLKWLNYTKSNSDKFLPLDDTQEGAEAREPGTAVYKGKPCKWSVFEEARFYLKKGTG